MSHTGHHQTLGRPRVCAGPRDIVRALTAAACFTSACGADLEPEETDVPAQLPLDQPPPSRADAGTLLLEASYAGAEPGPLVAWLSPLTGSSGVRCPLPCAFAPARCDPECHPRWTATGGKAEWPGVSSLHIAAVPPAHYWLFAHVSLQGREPMTPAAGDPVSRGAPLVVEVRPEQLTRVSLALDASFAPAVTTDGPSGCRLRLADEHPARVADDSARTAARELSAACSER